MSRALRVAMLAHSTNPRGGVVHAMELAEALGRLGHAVTLHAPDERGAGFWRPVRAATALVPAAPAPRGLAELVAQRCAEYAAFFARDRTPYDVWHAQDGISGNALASLAERGRIGGYTRTVHHVDAFADPELGALERRAVATAERVLCVSRRTAHDLRDRYGIEATVVPSGVDRERFAPGPVRAPGPARYLAVGGIEPRKNALAVLEAFALVAAADPTARLAIAGGATLLDHAGYRSAFDARLAACALGDRVAVLGTVPDGRLAALYRESSALVFPSLHEGFGLAALEAMASGTPAIVSRIAPFTEHLRADECLWVDPRDPGAIAAAMLRAREPRVAAALRDAGLRAAARFDWDRSARAHERAYRAAPAPARTPLAEELAPCPR